MSQADRDEDFLGPAERTWADRCRRRFVVAPAEQVQPRALVLLGNGSAATLIEEAAREWFRKQGGCSLIDSNLLVQLHPFARTIDEDTLEQTCGAIALQLLDEALLRRVHLLVRLPMIWDISEELGTAPRLEELPETMIPVLEAWVGRLTDEDYLCEILAVLPESALDEVPKTSPWDYSRLIRITSSPGDNQDDLLPAVESEEVESPELEPGTIEVESSPTTIPEHQPETSESGRAARAPAAGGADTGVGVSMGGTSPDTRVRSTPAHQNPRLETPPDLPPKTNQTLERLRALQANIRRLADAGPE